MRLKLVFKIHSSSGTLTLRPVNNTREISSILQTFFSFRFCKNSGHFSRHRSRSSWIFFVLFLFFGAKGFNMGLNEQCSQPWRLQVPRKDKSRRKIEYCAKLQRELSAMYKSPRKRNRNVVDQNIPGITLLLLRNLEFKDLCGHNCKTETLKKWKIIIIMYGKITKKCNLS